ncbi:SGNH/GDSL hydrolase family protein [Kitasatospora sp. McL0602]|uniref:SGNH/GDSL hydrolase family protein n=1 Tax=Kitasatospora sp. McL0602 TaxID=3439530 RepID=UPI003F892209
MRAHREALLPVRFAALGDSLTEGVGDAVPGGWRGWAALLAPALADGPVEFRNLGRSGALSGSLTAEQLPVAVALRPHFAAVVVGGNDTLRAGFDIGRTAEHLDTAMRALDAAGAVLLTACLPDAGQMLRLPQPLARPLARRTAAVNSVVHALSERHRAVHLHLTGLPWLAERPLLSVDRLHPSPAGHHRIAHEFHRLLAEAQHPVGPAPVAEDSAPAPGRAADLRWMATQGTRWLVARCTDLLPGLLALAAVETRHRLRGTTALLDARSADATSAALHRLGLDAPPSAAAQRASPCPLPGPPRCRAISSA